MDISSGAASNMGMDIPEANAGLELGKSSGRYPDRICVLFIY